MLKSASLPTLGQLGASLHQGRGRAHTPTKGGQWGAPTGIGARGQGGQQLRGAGLGSLQNIQGLRTRKSLPSMGATSSDDMGVGTNALIESRLRVQQSRQAAIDDRRQTREFAMMNQALDLENEHMFRKLLKKKAQLKIEALPPRRVSVDGQSLEPLEGGKGSPGRSSSPLQPCSVCMADLAPGQIVRQMVGCCGTTHHVGCLRSFLTQDARCPHCLQQILDKSEVNQLASAVR